VCGARPVWRRHFAALGIAPEGVTDVIFIHAHDDHFVGALYEADGALHPRFPHAWHLIGRADWDGNPRRENSDDDLAQRRGALAARGLLVPVDGEFAVAPGVTILPTPGESPGHQIVRVSSQGGDVLCARRSLPSRERIRAPRPVLALERPRRHPRIARTFPCRGGAKRGGRGLHTRALSRLGAARARRGGVSVGGLRRTMKAT